MFTPALSIIIPTLNEEKNLPVLIGQLKAQKDIALEIIIADGASVDNTKEVAAKCGCIVVCCEAGRAKQMNAGAAHARAEYLLFLHADSLIEDPSLLANAFTVFSQTIEQHANNNIAGHFPIYFKSGAKRKHVAYNFYEAKSALNRIETINGDQGLLISKSFFNRLGGYCEEFSFLEDQKISKKIFEQGLWLRLPGHLGTSTRRFDQEGFARRMILSAMIMGLYNIESREIFTQGPQLYKEQSASKKLDLAQLFSKYHLLVWQKGLTQYLNTWLKLGAYVRKNAWQLFFLVDICLGYENKPLLRFHDRVFAPLTNFIVFDFIASLVTYLCFMIGWLFFSVKR